MLRGGILRSVGNFREVLSQRILVGIILVGRLGVRAHEREVSESTVIDVIRISRLSFKR